jgi:hypothetical protein
MIIPSKYLRVEEVSMHVAEAVSNMKAATEMSAYQEWGKIAF